MLYITKEVGHSACQLSVRLFLCLELSEDCNRYTTAFIPPCGVVNAPTASFGVEQRER